MVLSKAIIKWVVVVSTKRYSLVYEPKYSSHQYVVQFKKNEDNYEFKHIQVEKYKGIIDCKKAKATLEDIDRLTNSFSSSNEFISNLKIYKPLHNFFISLPKKGYVNRIIPVFNNEELASKLKLVHDGKIDDKEQIKEFIIMLLEDDKEFYRFFKNRECYKSSTLKQLVRDLRHYNEMLAGWPDHEINYMFDETKKNLKEELKKYYVYREFLLAKQEFLKKQDSKPKETKEPVIKKEDVSPRFVPLEAEEQLIISGFPKIKRK